MDKKFTDTIEMIDLDDVGIDEMEISYDAMNDSNPELGASVEMAMQETTVFSTEELSAVLEKSVEADEATIVMEAISDEDVENYSEELEYEEAEYSEEMESEEYDEEMESEEYSEDLESEEYIEAAEEYSEEMEAEEYSEEGEEYSEEYEEDETEYTEEAEEDDFEDDFIAPVKPRKKKKKGAVGFLRNLGVFEFAVAAVAIVIVALLVVIGVKFISNKQNENKQANSQFATLGLIMENMDGIGNDGINAIGQKAYIESISKKDTDTTEEKTEVVDEEEEEEEEEEEAPQASVNFSSMEKDLKIKFTDKKTGKLITGVKFEVTAKGPDGKSYDWFDTDMDGVIYVDKLEPGAYEVKIVSIDPYEFPETATKVIVQDAVVYQVINVVDEAASMSEVDLGKEEFTGPASTTENVMQDTVEWVATSVTKSDKPVSYNKIDKSQISAPQTANTKKVGNYMKVDGEEDPPVAPPVDPPVDPPVATVAGVTVSGGGTIKVGGTTTVSADVTMDPAESTKAEVSWSSSDTSIATVSGGTVTGVAPGTVTITASAGDKSANCTVTVEAQAVMVTGITISGNGNLVKGQTSQLSAAVAPDTATNKGVTWTTDNEAVAKVDANGLVTAQGPGKATIKATANDGTGIAGSITIDVQAPALKLTVKGPDGNEIGSSITVMMGTTYQLSSIVEGYVADGTVTYTSSVTTSATVNEKGLITPVAKDTTTNITIATKEKDASGNPITKTITVNVKNDPKTDTVTPLKTTDGNQVYVKDASGNYVEAKWADYFTASEFFVGDFNKYTGWQTINGKVYYYDKNGTAVKGEQIIQGAKYNFASDGVLTMDNGTMGIDVSVYQGSIDWKAVKDSGISFVIIRCGFRGYGTGRLVKDTNFYSYIKGANDVGLKVGIYVFSQAINEAEAVEEASLCVNMAQGYRVSYPIFIDVESVPAGGRANALTKDERTRVCKAFCETIKSAGYTPGVYANKDYLRNKLNASELNGYKIWLAHYCTTTDYTGKYDLWQRSSKGSVNGIKGNVDLDVSYLGY